MAERNGISGREAVRAFQKAGWEPVGRMEGYVAMGNGTNGTVLIVPQYKSLSIGTMRALIRHAGLEPERFLALLLDGASDG